MKLQCLSENLNAALPLFKSVVPKKTSLPILENVLLATDNSRLKIVGTNLNMALVAWIGARVEDEGAVTIPYKALADLIKGRKELLTLVRDGDETTISSDTISATLRGIVSDEYPLVETINGTSAKCSYDALLTGLRRVIHCGADDETRPVLNTISMTFKGHALTLVAADGFRLAVTEVELYDEVKDASILLPLESAEALVKILAFAVKNRLNDEVVIAISTSRNQIGFDLGNLYLLSRIEDGTYPKYQAVIPAKNHATTVLSGEAKGIAAAARACKDYSDVNISRLTVENGKVSLSAKGEERGETTQSLSVDIKGESVTIAVNWKLLEEAMLAVNGTGKCEIRLQHPSQPLRIDSENLVQVVMPMHLHD